MAVQFWDIETSSIEPFQADARVTIIGIMSEADEVLFFCDQDEAKLLESFWEWTRQHSSDTLVGFNSIAFDYKYLLKRSIVCDVKPYLPFRRMNFDLRNAIDDNKFAKGTLGEICTLINGQAKFENLTGEEVIKLFYDGDYEKLKKYLAQDLALTKTLYTRLRGLSII